MYPLIGILLVSRVYEIKQVPMYVLPLSGLGLGISVYHSYIQVTSDALCGTGGCSAVLFRLFGIFSIPNLAGIAFILITSSMILYLLTQEN